MTCSEFLADFSSFHDEDPSLRDAGAFHAHLEACPSCRRYRDVVERGVALLRELPPPTAREDLQDRIRHSIYTYEEERRRARDSQGSSRVMAIVATAAVLAALLWSPRVWEGEPSVDLAPIVVQAPGPGPSGPFTLTRTGASTSAAFLELELWTESNALLYEHSPLFQRSREPGLVRTGLR